MKRVLCFIYIIMLACSANAQKTIDFATKFMRECKGDSILQCVAVSPKMMDMMTRQQNQNHNDRMVQAIPKLKSAQIITANRNGEYYFAQAEILMKRNAKRFKMSKSYEDDNKKGVFYSRQLKNGQTVELVLLHVSDDKLVIVNLTGDIDDEFVNMLSNNVAGKTSQQITRKQAGRHT